MEGPDEPQMGKILQTAEGVGVPIFRLKNDGGLQRVHQSALAGDTEFGGKIAADVCNNFHGKILFHGKNLVSKKRCFYYTGFCKKREQPPRFSVRWRLFGRKVLASTQNLWSGGHFQQLEKFFGSKPKHLAEH
jgi:hypothetical protein